MIILKQLDVDQIGKETAVYASDNRLQVVTEKLSCYEIIILIKLVKA